MLVPPGVLQQELFLLHLCHQQPAEPAVVHVLHPLLMTSALLLRYAARLRCAAMLLVNQMLWHWSWADAA